MSWTLCAITKTGTTFHTVWFEWTEGMYINENQGLYDFPEEWKSLLHNCTDRQSAYHLVNFLESLQPKGDIDVYEFVEWLRDHAHRGATFELKKG